MKHETSYIDSKYCVKNVSQVYTRRRFKGSKTYQRDNDTNWIIYMKKGMIDYTISNNHYSLKEGSTLFIPSNSEFHSIVDSCQSVEYLLISFYCIGEDSSILSLLHGGYAVGDSNTNITSQLDLLELNWREKPIYYKAKSISLVQLIIYHILYSKIQRYNIGKSYKRLECALEYIHNNYSGKVLVRDLANMVNMSTSRFRDVFSQAQGISPNEYLQNIRLLHSKDLLYANMNISEIAYKCGYSSLSYFSRSFKNRYGLSPRQYQRIFINGINKLERTSLL